MVCIYCRHDSRVVNTRLQKRSNTVWRRRKCVNCGALWTSLERSDYATTWRVDQNGHLLVFQYETLYTSIYEALKHRKSPVTDATYITKTVIEKLLKSQAAIFSTATLVKTTYNILRRYDKLAAELYKTTHPS